MKVYADKGFQEKEEVEVEGRRANGIDAEKKDE